MSANKSTLIQSIDNMLRRYPAVREIETQKNRVPPKLENSIDSMLDDQDIVCVKFGSRTDRNGVEEIINNVYSELRSKYTSQINKNFEIVENNRTSKDSRDIEVYLVL